MLIAWVFLSSVGVVAARHCKHMLESKLFFKVKLWFQVNYKEHFYVRRTVYILKTARVNTYIN